jgi:hypothetical protein
MNTTDLVHDYYIDVYLGARHDANGDNTKAAYRETCNLLLVAVNAVRAIAAFLFVIALALLARAETPESFGAQGDGIADDTAALTEWANRWSVTSEVESIELELTAGKVYRFTRPIILTLGATRTSFCCDVDGHNAWLMWDGGRGQGAAFQVGDHANDRRALDCSFQRLRIGATNKGADCLLQLDFGTSCRFESMRVRGPGTHTVDVGIQINNQQSLRFDQVNVGFCSTGAQSGEINNVFNWDSGKVFECDVGIKYDGSTASFWCIDLSKCRRHALWLTKASQVRVFIYSEQIGPIDENGNFVIDPDSSVVRIDKSEHVDISGLLNCKRAGFTGAANCRYGVDAYSSRSIKIGNVECLAPSGDIYRSDVEGAVTVDTTAIKKVSRWIPAGPTP